MRGFFFYLSLSPLCYTLPMTQQEALNILKSGANVFLTGEPGSGKTHTIREYVNYLQDRGVDPAITASTGIAATHIHGMTIHAWSGIGIRRTLTDWDLDQITSNEYVVKRVNTARVLIIDEISMLSGKTLDMVNAVCKEVRKNSEPFGGLQVVLVGDFFQLPPIGDEGREPEFAFSSAAWKDLKPLVCYLEEQHRQEDPMFLSILSAIRKGEIEQEHTNAIASRINEEAEGTETTRLFTHNADVDRLNDEALQSTPGETRTFVMESAGSKALVAALIRGCISPEVLPLKIGARVMCTKNNSREGYVNGTLGTVVAFMKDSGYPVIETLGGYRLTIEPQEWMIEENGKVRAKITQIPLRLAWAITIHKSQGMSMDAAVIDLGSAFTFGQGYVALSRVRTLQGIQLLSLNETALEVHPQVREVDESFQELSEKAQAGFAVIPEEKLAEMHAQFIRAIGGSEKLVPRKKEKKIKAASELKTLELLQDGKNIAEIAEARNMVESTIYGHIDLLAEKGQLDRVTIEHIISPALQKAFPEIKAAFEKLGLEKLSPVRSALKYKYSYEDLKLARAIMKLA